MNVLQKFRDKFSRSKPMQALRNYSVQAIEFLRSKFPKFFSGEKKYQQLFLTVTLLIAAGLIVPTAPAHAFWEEMAGGVLRYLIYPIVYVIFWFLFQVAYMIAQLGAIIISINLNPAIMNAVLTSPNILKGWQIFRDIANLLYILILLLIALGTIFRSDTYNIKKLLPKLIIVAFLLNFSMMLTELVIDFGNILMYGILRMMCPPGDTSCFQNFFSQMMMAIDGFRMKYDLSVSNFIHVEAQDAVSLAIATIYTFIYGLTLMALGVFLLIRIAVFAVLIIISPLAFFGEIAPGLKKVTNEWWDKVLSYSLFGPIFALLLYVAGLMAQITFTVDPTTISTNLNLGPFGTLFATIISNIIPLIFLLSIPFITKNMGMIGAGMVMSSTVGVSAAVGGFAGSYIGSKADRWLARGAQDQRKGVRGTLNRARAYLSPTVWKRANKASNAEKDHDYDVAVGSARGKMARIENLGRKPPIDYKRDAYEREVERTKKDIVSDNSQELASQMKEFLDQGMISHAEGVARKLAASGDINTTMGLYEDVKGNPVYANTPEGFTKFMREKFEPKLGEQQTAILMSDIAQMEKKDGNHSFKGSSYYDQTNKQWKIQVPTSTAGGAVAPTGYAYTKYATEAAKEFGKVDPQAKWKGLNARTLLDEVDDIDPATGAPRIDPATGKNIKKWALADRGELIINSMTTQDFDRIKVAKPDQLRKLKTSLGALNAAQIARIDAAKRTELENKLNLLNL